MDARQSGHQKMLLLDRTHTPVMFGFTVFVLIMTGLLVAFAHMSHALTAYAFTRFRYRRFLSLWDLLLFSCGMTLLAACVRRESLTTVDNK